MDEKQKKILKWEIVGGLIVNLLVLILSIAKVLSWGWFISIFIASIFLTLIIFSAFVFIAKRKEVGELPKVAAITIEDARNLANLQLYDLKMLERVDEVIENGIRYEGEESRDNIFEYLVRGAYDKNLISVLVNMKTREVSIKTYDDSKIKMSDIKINIDERANKLSQKPGEKETRTRITESPFTGVREEVKEEFKRLRSKEEEKKEGLE